MNNPLPATSYHSPLKIQKPAFALQSLSQDELMSLIMTQGKIIGMGKWEINALIETFQKKNTLRKAYHILLEYSQLHNDIHKLILKRQSYMHKVLSFLKAQQKQGVPVSSPAEVGHIASKLAEYSVKAWIAICRWRQLQWSPRPILFPLSPLPASAAPQEGREKGEPVNIIKLFEDDAGDIFNLSSQHGIHLIDAGVKPVHLITILVSSAANVLSDTAIANAILRPPEVDSCEWANENPADSHTQREVGILLSPYSEFISSLRDIAQIELSFDNVWQTFSSFKGTNQKNQSQNLPILKLHYNNTMIDAGAQDMSPKYYDACEVLLNFLVRNFSVVPSSSTKRGTGGDLHTSVLKSLANINGDALISTSPPNVSPTNVNFNNNNNHLTLAHSQFTASSPIPKQRKVRPQSSPLIRSLGQQEQEQEQEQSSREELDAPRPSSAFESGNLSHNRSTSTPGTGDNQMQSPSRKDISLDVVVEGNKKRPLDNELNVLDDNNTKDVPEMESFSELARKNDVSVSTSLIEDTLATSSTNKNPAETEILSVKFDNNANDGAGNVSMPSNQLIPASKSVMSVKEKKEQSEVDLVITVAGDLLLTWKRVANQEKQLRGGGSRLVVADFQAFCPAETMRLVNIGDEIVRVAGVAVEGKMASDVTATCKAAGRASVAQKKLKAKNNNSSPPPVGVTVAVTLRKQYAGREAVLAELKNLSSVEQQSILAIREDDVPALETVLQRLKKEVVHLEQCMEAVGQDGFHNVRHQMMKTFGLMKTVQYKLSTALTATVEAQKLEVVRLEEQREEALRQEALRQEALRQEALRQEALRQEAQKREDKVDVLKTADNQRGRTNTLDILEEDNLDALSWSQKKKKRKNTKRPSQHRDSTSQLSHPYARSRPLIASLHFGKHWCGSIFDCNDRNGFARGVIHLRSKDSNSNSTMYNYAKARVVSNTIKHALRRVEVKGKGESRPVLAARKLCSWWGLIYPQKTLTVRMQIKTMVLDIVEDMVVRSFEIGAASTKRRNVMLRMAAATLIQQTFRKWKSTVLMHVIKIQKFGKRFLTRAKVLKLVNVVRAAVLVARFLYRRKIRLRMIVGKRVHYRRVIRNYLDHIGYLKRDTNQKDLLQLVTLGRNSKLVANFAVNSRQGYMLQRRVDACIKIQSFFRMVAAQWYHKYLVQEDYICKKVRCAMKILQLRRKILNKRKLRIAAVKMQRTWRGCASRWKLYLQVIAGIKITAAWRKYRQYWKLKQCLRRIELPVEIVLHGIRNIAAQLIYSRKIKVRVSVWWNSLLHLVDNKDFMTITQSKQPHIIRTTGFYDCQLMPEVIAPAPVAVAPKTASLPPPVTAIKPRGGKRLSLMAQAQKINVGDSKKDENSLSAFVNRQSQNAARQAQEKKASVSLKGIVKKSMLTSLAITPINGGDSDDESESSSDSSSSSSCSDNSGESGENLFDDNNGGNNNTGGYAVGGRKSDIGSNLLGDSPSQMSLPPLTLPPGFSANEQAAPSAPAPRRTTMMRVSSDDLNPDGSQKAKKTLSGTVNLINKGLLGFSSAFKASQVKKKEEEKIIAPKSSNVYQCDLNEETLYIPGCHGNAVIRFDLFDGDRKFGSNLFQLSEDKKLLFWGGEFNRDVTVTKIRRAVQLGNNIRETERNRLVKHEENPILDVRVVSGAPLRSKCGWALVSIRGMGPIKRQRRAKGGFTKLFDDWDRGYLSMDGVNIYCYTSKNAPNPWIIIPLSDIKSIHIELNALSKGGDSNKKKSAPTEDKFDVVVTSSSRDIFHFKFPGSSARENWVRIIVDAVDYSRESLRTRLNLKQVSGKSEKHMGIF